MKHEYDPIKILNKSKFLNEAAIKCRYDLMHINRFYDAKGIKFKKNIFLPYVYHKFDRDIIDYGNKMKHSSYQDLKSQAEMIVNKIQESSIIEKLNKIDHTSIANVKKSRFNLGFGRNSPESRNVNLMNVSKIFKIDLEKKHFDEENKELFNKDSNINVNLEDKDFQAHTDFSKHNFEFSKFRQSEQREKNNNEENKSKLDENTSILNPSMNAIKNDLIYLNEIEKNSDIDPNLKTENSHKSKNSKKFEKLPKMIFSKFSQNKKIKIKKPKTINLINYKISNSLQNNEEDNFKHYNTTDIKTFNNFSLNNLDPVKSESHLIQLATKTSKSINFAKLINQEKLQPILSKFKSNQSNTNTQIEEFSICTYNNTQHLIKNFLLDEKQIEKLQENNKRTQTIRKITNSPIKFTHSKNSLKNDKILLSDLLNENFEFERKHLNQISENFKTPKNSHRENNFNTISDRGNSVNSKSSKKITKLSNENKYKISSKFKDKRIIEIEKFDSFLKNLERTVKLESERKIRDSSLQNKKQKKKANMKIKLNEIKLNKVKEEEKRLVILKNIKNVNSYIESINLKVSKVMKNVEDDIVNFQYLKENFE